MVANRGMWPLALKCSIDRSIGNILSLANLLVPEHLIQQTDLCVGGKVKIFVLKRLEDT